MVVMLTKIIFGVDAESIKGYAYVGCGLLCKKGNPYSVVNAYVAP